MLSWTYRAQAEASQEERNLMYVAITRAKKVLHYVSKPANV